jgi:SOS-response transcriptional repressor LexA
VVTTPLTARQREILLLVERRLQATGCAPTIRELCAALGFASTNSAADHLRAIHRKGYVVLPNGRARRLSLTARWWAERQAEGVHYHPGPCDPLSAACQFHMAAGQTEAA